MKNRIPAEVFPPGDFLKEELDARDWTQTDLAEILGRPMPLVNGIVLGKRRITPDTAKDLAEALGTSAELWMNLESTYQLSKVRDQNSSIERKARLYSKAPINHMIKRGWIERSENLDVLEKRVLDFLEMDNPDQEPDFGQHAARKSTTYHEVTNAQTAWLFRAKHLAKSVSAAPFSIASFRKAIERLQALLQSAEEIRHVPRALSEAGIRFLVVEALPKSRIDGACFWLDARSPVIALSMRYDRIDYFWFTLMHDLGHVNAKDGLSDSDYMIDINFMADETVVEKPEFEKVADRFAAESLMPQDAFADFVVRNAPLYPRKKIRGFAALNHIHPGIVVGQLHHRGLSYAAHRDLLDKVRDIITDSALTDGWGNVVPTAT